MKNFFQLCAGFLVSILLLGNAQAQLRSGGDGTSRKEQPRVYAPALVDTLLNFTPQSTSDVTLVGEFRNLVAGILSKPFTSTFTVGQMLRAQRYLKALVSVEIRDANGKPTGQAMVVSSVSIRAAQYICENKEYNEMLKAYGTLANANSHPEREIRGGRKGF